MATPGVDNKFYQHDLQIAQSIVTYIIPTTMSVFGVSVQRTNLAIMSLLASNTPGGITTCTECLVMPAPRQLMPNSDHGLSTEGSTRFDIFPPSWVTSHSQTCSIQCRSPCLTTSRSGLYTSWRWMNGLTSTVQCSYPCLLYHDLKLWNLSYEEVSQWNGKEIKEISRFLLGVETQSAWGGSPTQHPIFNRSMGCTQALLEFYMYVSYKSHNDATLS